MIFVIYTKLKLMFMQGLNKDWIAFNKFDRRKVRHEPMEKILNVVRTTLVSNVISEYTSLSTTISKNLTF